MINGLCNINIELTSECNKNCWMCGRRKRERELGPQNYGHMDFRMVTKISHLVPKGIVVQFHNNGEPLLYPQFGEAVRLFPDNVTNIVTNGKLLTEKADEIIDNLDILSVSIIQSDEEADAQYESILSFLTMKGDRKPYTTLRFVGTKTTWGRYSDLGVPIITRTLHAPQGSVEYKKVPTKPEIGVCWDFLTRLAIDRYGNVSPCVRFDPEGVLHLGNVRKHTLENLWNSEKRMKMKEMHCSGRRSEIPFCGDQCDYWGVPTAS